MKKILLFYINGINGGGAARVIIQLAAHFALCGYKCILITSFVDEGREYPIPDNVERISIEQEEIRQNRLKRNVDRIKKLRELCKLYEPDALISFMAEPNLRAVLAARGLKTKTIVSVRNDPSKEYRGVIGRLVGKFILPMADGCVFQTEDAKSWFPLKLQKKSKVIFNDVDHVFFETDYIGGEHIVTLGRLTDQKNQKILIDAYAGIADKYPNNDLLIYGVGSLKDELQAQIDTLAMSDRIHLMGLTTCAQDVLSRAGIFVLSSDYEGMPNALMEALAIGVPSISTDCPCGGPRMLIQSGENGLIVPVGDVDALSRELDHLLSDSRLAKRLGENARKSAQSYKTEAVFQQWKEYVEGIIQE